LQFVDLFSAPILFKPAPEIVGGDSNLGMLIYVFVFDAIAPY